MRDTHKIFVFLAILCCAVQMNGQPATPCDEADQARMAANRAEIAARHWHFQVGCSSVALRDVKDVTGYALPAAERGSNGKAGSVAAWTEEAGRTALKGRQVRQPFQREPAE